MNVFKESVARIITQYSLFSSPSFMEKSNNGVIQWSFWDFLKRKDTAAVIPELVGCKRLGGVSDKRTGSSRKAQTREAGCLPSFIHPTICTGSY